MSAEKQRSVLGREPLNFFNIHSFPVMPMSGWNEFIYNTESSDTFKSVILEFNTAKQGVVAFDYLFCSLYLRPRVYKVKWNL